MVRILLIRLGIFIIKDYFQYLGLVQTVQHLEQSRTL